MGEHDWSYGDSNRQIDREFANVLLLGDQVRVNDEPGPSAWGIVVEVNAERDVVVVNVPRHEIAGVATEEGSTWATEIKRGETRVELPRHDRTYYDVVLHAPTAAREASPPFATLSAICGNDVAELKRIHERINDAYDTLLKGAEHSEDAALAFNVLSVARNSITAVESALAIAELKILKVAAKVSGDESRKEK